LKSLSNTLLIEAYKKAKQCNLDANFIKLLEKELWSRKINPKNN